MLIIKNFKCLKNINMNIDRENKLEKSDNDIY